MELNVYHDPDNACIVVETGISQRAPFKLFDMIGKLVLSVDAANGERISIKNIEKGVYHYKLVAGERLQVGKIRL